MADQEHIRQLLEDAEAYADRRAWLVQHFTSLGHDENEPLTKIFIDRHAADPESFEILKRDEEDGTSREKLRAMCEQLERRMRAAATMRLPSVNSVRLSEPIREETKSADDSKWPRQAGVARGLGLEPYQVKRLIDAGELLTNGKTGHDCRVNPGSVLDYCHRTGITYNEDATTR